MKTGRPASWIALALLTSAVPRVSAFTYSPNDLLLVLRRDGFSDVEFNLGSVSNYTALASGTQVNVTNWNPVLAKSSFNGSLSGVSFILLAATSVDDPSKRVWLSNGNPAITPLDVTGSKYSQLRSKIDFVGTQAQVFTATNATKSYVVSPSDGSSYSSIASSGGTLDLSTLGGLASFPVEGVIPANLTFHQLQVSTINPKPAATVVGSFNLTVAGTLVFTAGAVTTPTLPPITAPRITSIERAGGATSIRFNAAADTNYRLVYATPASVHSPSRVWVPIGTPLQGNGATLELKDTVADGARFYAVEASR